MRLSPALSDQPSIARRAAARGRGFTLIEIMVSLAVLSIASMGGVAAFMTLNRYAANIRNMAVARALCQERIEQALTLTFRPTASVTPAAPSSDPTNTSTMNILGVASSSGTTQYNTTTGACTAGAGYQTSSETIPIYTQSDGTSAKSSANVTYTRTTTISPTALTYTGSAPTTSLNIVLFTVNVSYVFHGQTYATSMTSLRSPD